MNTKYQLKTKYDESFGETCYGDIIHYGYKGFAFLQQLTEPSGTQDVVKENIINQHKDGEPLLYELGN